MFELSPADYALLYRLRVDRFLQECPHLAPFSPKVGKITLALHCQTDSQVSELIPKSADILEQALIILGVIELAIYCNGEKKFSFKLKLALLSSGNEVNTMTTAELQRTEIDQNGDGGVTATAVETVAPQTQTTTTQSPEIPYTIAIPLARTADKMGISEAALVNQMIKVGAVKEAQCYLINGVGIFVPKDAIARFVSSWLDGEDISINLNTIIPGGVQVNNSAPAQETNTASSGAGTRKKSDHPKSEYVPKIPGGFKASRGDKDTLIKFLQAQPKEWQDYTLKLLQSEEKSEKRRANRILKEIAGFLKRTNRQDIESIKNSLRKEAQAMESVPSVQAPDDDQSED